MSAALCKESKWPLCPSKPLDSTLKILHAHVSSQFSAYIRLDSIQQIPKNIRSQPINHSAIVSKVTYPNPLIVEIT